MLFLLYLLLSTHFSPPDEIVNGFKEVGFVYLSGHGIGADTVKTTFERVRYFLLFYFILEYPSITRVPIFFGYLLMSRYVFTTGTASVLRE